MKSGPIPEGHSYARYSGPLLLLINSLIGLSGYVNLVSTVSWYEGIFIVVLAGYLVLRGLLGDAMEKVSRLLIRHVTNGWLWTEAFLKPIDRVLRITLFLFAWASSFYCMAGTGNRLLLSDCTGCCIIPCWIF